MTALKVAPRMCPVCSQELVLTRLGCDDCGTELSGHFPTCGFCALSPEDRESLEIFLASRGNMKVLERHLGLSYPTTRARFDTILNKLGLSPEEEDAPPEPAPVAPTTKDQMEALQKLESGEIDIDEALKRIG